MDQNAIWDYFQNEAPEHFTGSRPRLAYLASRIERGAKVLNIGVGAGIFEEEALARGLDIHSLDPVERTISAIQQRLSLGDKARLGSSTSLPFPDASFGAVVLSEVMEHLSAEATEQSLAEIARVLEPGGRLIGTVPAREELSAQMVVCPGCSLRFHRWGHMQSFEPRGLSVLLSRYLEVVEIWQRQFVDWGQLNWKGKVLAAALRVLRLAGIHGSGESLFFVARKK